MDIGKRIYNRRIELGLSLSQLGNKVGVSKSTISRWETGKIENLRAEQISKLAIALKVSPLYLIGMSDEKPDFLVAKICEQVKTLNEEQLNQLDSMMKIMFKK